MDSPESIRSKKHYPHNVRAIRANRLKPAIRNVLVPRNGIRKEGGSVREPSSDSWELPDSRESVNRKGHESGHLSLKPFCGRRIFIQCRYWEELRFPYEVPNCIPVLDKFLAPIGTEILSSAGAGVWREAPVTFPDSSSVLDKLQSAIFGPSDRSCNSFC